MAGNEQSVDETCVDLHSWGEHCGDSAPGLSSLKTGFILLLKLFFSHPAMMGPWEEALACVTKNKLKIYSGSSTDPADTENVPAIVVSSGDGLQLSCPFLRAPQGNIGGDYSTEVNMHQCDVAITFLVRHYDSDIADMMADALMMLLIGSEQQIRQTWPWIIAYLPTAQTEARRARQATDPEAFEDWYEARVTIKLIYMMSVTVRQESKRLEEVHLHGNPVD